MRDWMKLIPPTEMAMFKKAGFLANLAPGRRAALIVVDVTMGFCGSEGLTLDEAIKQFPTACGPSSWVAMPKIARLIAAFRRVNLPIVYTLSSVEDAPWAGKATKSAGRPPAGFNDFPQAIAPHPTDWQLRKTKASAFFQTPLSAYLTRNRVDTLEFCGVSTSGCVRASVVDGFSHGFATFVVDDCCFDRSEFAHAANLLDMMAKYAVVQSLDEALALRAAVPIAAE
jgi:nicotinamidase-related amidase